MRLKSLIESEIKNIDEFEEELHQNYLDTNKHLLWRQSTKNIKSWGKRGIRKDRKPKGSAPFVQVLLDLFATSKSEDIPLRSESKFASTRKFEKYVHGDEQYIVFPEKSANLASFPYDSVDYRREMKYPFIKMSKDWQEKLKDFSTFLEFIVKSANLKKSSGSETVEYKRWVMDNWNEIIKDRQKLYQSDLSDNVKETVIDFFNAFHNYFDEMKLKIEAGSREVMFDGSSYLLIEPKLFENNFKWNGSKWERV